MPTKSHTLKPLRMDWYILTEVIGPFFGGVIFFLFLFLMAQILRLAEFFIEHGVSAWILTKMALFLMLSFLPTAIPVAFLIAVLMAFGRLSADSELVAMKANGFSSWRLSLPLVGFAVILGCFSIALSMEWVPWGETAFKRTLIKVGRTKVASTIKEGTFTTGFFDLLVFADKVDSKKGRLQRVFVFDEREPKNPLAVVAKAGEILPVKTGSELGSAAILKLYDGSINSNDSQTNSYQRIGFGEYRLYLKIDEGVGDNTTKPRMIPYQQLMQKIRNNPPTTFEGIEMRGELWRRFAIAFTPLVFVFLGIGYGSVRTRAVRAGAALIAFVVLVLYWGIETWATLQLQRGTIPPHLAMALPNATLLILAVIGFRKASW